MTWYYVKDGAASGPISDDDFASQFGSGSILPTTLVWRSGMAQWETASSVADEIARRTATPITRPASSHDYPITSGPAEPVSNAPPVLPGFFCTYCGNIIPADQLVRIGGRNVCAACKPRFVQQVTEGLSAPLKVPVLGSRIVMVPENDLADPGLRFVAYLLDVLFAKMPVIGAIMLVFLLAGITGSQLGQASGANEMIIGLLFMSVCLAGVVWIFFYWTYFVGKRGATPGMKIMKLKMVCADRTLVTYSRALGRVLLLNVINGCTMGLTNITAFFDNEKRTVVDMICDTRVVRNEKSL
jgi:uncharacterized RDD family membrane protein YckC